MSLSPSSRITGRLAALALLLLGGGLARSESSVSASVLASRDDQGYQLERYQAAWGREAPADGQRLAVRWHRYALGNEFAGVLPFAGAEPAAELGGYLLRGFWWYGAAIGFQGSPDRHGATGELIVARGIPTGAGTFTPRLEVTRGPLAMSALPLSLAMVSNRGQALLGWRTDGWMAEGGVRVDFWESVTLPGRVRNGELDVIAANRIAIVHGYVLTQRQRWLDWGLSAKSAWSRHNTLLATQLLPSWQYSWYPASAPPQAWETALILRAQARPGPSFWATLQLALPLLSRETRQWDATRQSEWGTAPFEGRLEGSWSFLPSTAIQLDAVVFAKPWARWNPWSGGAYRQAAVQLSVKQGI